MNQPIGWARINLEHERNFNFEKSMGGEIYQRRGSNLHVSDCQKFIQLIPLSQLLIGRLISTVISGKGSTRTPNSETLSPIPQLRYLISETVSPRGSAKIFRIFSDKVFLRKSIKLNTMCQSREYEAS